MEAAERIHCELDDTRVNTAGTHHTFSIRAVMRSAYAQSCVHHTSANVNTRQHKSAYVSKFSTRVNAAGTHIRHMCYNINVDYSNTQDAVEMVIGAC